MVLKNVGIAIICTTLLAWGSASLADEYRPDEFLRLDLSKALLSPKPLGPASKFAPVAVEAKTDHRSEDAQARAELDGRFQNRQNQKDCNSQHQSCAYAGGKTAGARAETAQRGSDQTGATTQQSAGRASVRHADPGLALQVGRHLQLEAVGINNIRLFLSSLRRPVGSQ